MDSISEPTAMAEVREIRDALSRELKGLTPQERLELIKRGAAQFEKEFGLKLRRAKTELIESNK